MSARKRKPALPVITPEFSLRKFRQFADKQEADNIGKRWENPYPTLQREVDQARLDVALRAEVQLNAAQEAAAQIHAKLQDARAPLSRGGKKRGQAVHEKSTERQRRILIMLQQLREKGLPQRIARAETAKHLKERIEYVNRVDQTNRRKKK